MADKVEKKKITQEDIMNLLDKCYLKAIEGIPNVSKSIEDLANDYMKKTKNPEKAAKSMLKNQIVKCSTSGFITGFGGFITLPVAIPANVSSVIYIQMRMIACTAYMAGLDIQSDQVQTLVYACLAGVSVNGVIKKMGIEVGQKLANNMIKKIPGTVLTKINQKVGFRFITKFGEKGIINMGKLVPGVGAVIGGGFDFVETKIIANRAYNMFFKGEFVEEQEDDQIIDVEYQEELS